MKQKTTYLIFLLGSLTALDPLSLDMYLPAFQKMQIDFNTSINLIELTVTTFFVGMALGQLIYGPLADRFGRKKPMQIGLLIYILSTIGCYFAKDIHSFIVFRLLQSLGGCAGMVITRAIIRDLFNKEQVAQFLSNMALIMGLAPIMAPSLGSIFVEHWGWRSIFLFLIFASSLCFVMISLFLPETLNPKYVKSIQPKETLRSYYSLITNLNFMKFLIPDTASRAGMFAYIAGSSFVFINILKISPQDYALIFGLNGLGLMFTSQINRLLLKKFSSERILKYGLITNSSLAIIVAMTSFILPTSKVLLFPLFLFIATLNFISSNSMASALAHQAHQAGTASALYGCLQWTLASGASLFVSHFHNDSSFPMTGTIALSGVIAVVCYYILNIKRLNSII